MTIDRHLDWDGCFNVRDLGGLYTSDGRKIRRGAIVRADSLDRLTPDGWRALTSYGIRTIIDLRNDEERCANPPDRPANVTTAHIPLDDTADNRLWDYIRDNELDGHPLYYPYFVQQKPQRCAAVLAAIAQARPGGVVIHCNVGRDRTGLITLLLLTLAGSSPDDIAADYELSATRLPALYAALGTEDQGPTIKDILKRKNTTARAAIHAAIKTIDTERCLHEGGLTKDQLTTIRNRLLQPA